MIYCGNNISYKEKFVFGVSICLSLLFPLTFFRSYQLIGVSPVYFLCSITPYGLLLYLTLCILVFYIISKVNIYKRVVVLLVWCSLQTFCGIYPYRIVSTEYRNWLENKSDVEPYTQHGKYHLQRFWYLDCNSQLDMTDEIIWKKK